MCSNAMPKANLPEPSTRDSGYPVQASSVELEDELTGQLNCTRSGECAIHGAEIGSEGFAGDGVAVIEALISLTKLRMVKGVKCFGPELELDPAVPIQREVLEEGSVKVIQAKGTEIVMGLVSEDSKIGRA